MDENRIRQIVQQEINKSNASSRFGLTSIPNHAHTGLDSSPQIKQSDVIPSISISGKVEFAQQTEYTLYLNSSFTPSRVQAYGSITGSSGKFICTGTANLTPSFYFQPNTDTNVVTGNIQYPTYDNAAETQAVVPIQSCVYYGIDGGGTAHVLASEGHILNVAYGSPQVVYARVTVTDFSRDFIKLKASTLASGWDIIANIVVT